jgi:hypothetical protein
VDPGQEPCLVELGPGSKKVLSGGGPHVVGGEEKVVGLCAHTRYVSNEQVAEIFQSEVGSVSAVPGQVAHALGVRKECLGGAQH